MMLLVHQKKAKPKNHVLVRINNYNTIQKYLRLLRNQLLVQLVFYPLVFILLNSNSYASSSSLKYFADSINYIQKSFSIPKGHKKKPSVQTMTKSDVEKKIYYAEKALEASKKVSLKELDDKMDKSLFYKTLSKNYVELFQKGTILYIEALKNGDTDKGLKANELLNKWGKYYRKKFF